MKARGCSMNSTGQMKTWTLWKLLIFTFLQAGISGIVFIYIRVSVNLDLGVPILQPPNPLRSSLLVEEKISNLTILLWTWPFGVRTHIEKCSRLLGIPDCHITVQRSWYPKADAVLIHHFDLYGNPQRLPQEPRPLSQRWIWFNLESPTTYSVQSFLDSRFNLTMTYRRDSDIYIPYGWMDVLPQKQNVTIPPKSKLVAWAVSNWKADSQRVKYYQELKKYLQVDVYGRHHLPLPRDQHLSTLTQYKFYLAFENSIHEDYITEKVWKNAFFSWAVPVVLGPPRKNYERHMPPDSFIHIDDFPSAQELANFLHELDRNTTRYESYFRWRSWLKPNGPTPWSFMFCKACRVLQENPGQYQTIPDLSKWFKQNG